MRSKKKEEGFVTSKTPWGPQGKIRWNLGDKIRSNLFLCAYSSFAYL